MDADQRPSHLPDAVDGGEQSTRHLTRFDESSESDSRLERVLADAVLAVVGRHRSEFRTYLALLDHPQSTPTELAGVLDTARRNVYRRLQQLRERGLVSRHRTVLSDGGQEYLYEAQSLAATSEWLQEQVEEWTETIDEQVRALQAVRQ